jgi:DNA-binding NtrC family response regulator
MNLATPILIANSNEDFRALLREMLTKHGFFHVIETTQCEETNLFLRSEKKGFFSLIQDHMLDEKILLSLEKQKNFLIIAQIDKPATIALAARLGVKHFISFPFSSHRLLEKIQQLYQ